MCLISFIIPMYNAEKTILSTLHELMESVHLEYEILLIDDGSTDGTGKLCRSYEAQFNQIKYYYEENQGPAIARNKGILEAKGEYLLFIDADDRINCDIIHQVGGLLKEKDLDILSFNAEKILVTGKREAFFKKRKGFKGDMRGKDFLSKSIAQRAMTMVVTHHIFRTQFLIENELFFKPYYIYEDEEWTPRVFYRANKVRYFDEVLYYYYENLCSITHTMPSDNRVQQLDLVIHDLLNFRDSIPRSEVKGRISDYIITLYLFNRRIDNYRQEGYITSKELIKMSRCLRNRLKVMLFIYVKPLYKRLSGLYQQREWL